MGAFLGWLVGALLAFALNLSLTNEPWWLNFLVGFSFALAGIYAGKMVESAWRQLH